MNPLSFPLDPSNFPAKRRKSRWSDVCERLNFDGAVSLSVTSRSVGLCVRKLLEIENSFRINLIR